MAVAIRKERHRSQEEMENLIIDATEQPIERSKRRQTKYYSVHEIKDVIQSRVTDNFERLNTQFSF